MHYHVWLRSGRVFTMACRPFSDRTVAHKWAKRQREDARDRLVLKCDGECPPAKRSRRRALRWGRIAADLAAALGADQARVRELLREAVERDKAAA